ncbi:hypothetical protein [Sphingobacterium sp. JUb56]|nr:hypothetical protein [Sphingobacterium sp. JUb56]
MKYTVIKTIRSEALMKGGIIEDQTIELFGSPKVWYGRKEDTSGSCFGQH